MPRRRPRGPVAMLGAGHIARASYGALEATESHETARKTSEGTGALPGAQKLVIEDFPDTVLARQLSPNGRAHWAVKQNARKKAADRIVGGCIVAGIRPVAVPVTITLRWVFPTAGRHDLDNLIATSKGFVDSLVKRGILPDDSSEHVTDIRAEVVIEKGRRALEIIIEPVEV